MPSIGCESAGCSSGIGDIGSTDGPFCPERDLLRVGLVIGRSGSEYWPTEINSGLFPGEGGCCGPEPGGKSSLLSSGAAGVCGRFGG